MIYLDLFLGFLEIGLFSFGGAYSAIPLIRDVVLRYGWLTDNEISYMIAVSESTPGPVMVNLATYIGSVKGGFLGSVIATLTVVLPAFIIIILFVLVLNKLLKNRLFNSVLDGIKASVIGIIFATGAFFILQNVIGSVKSFSFNLPNLILTVILALIYFGSRKLKPKFKVSPILLIVISAILGIFVFCLLGVDAVCVE